LIRGRYLVGLCALGEVLLWLGTASGAELRGRMTLANGRPAANEAIRVNNREIGRTDAAGGYLLNLPAGRHVLTVRGQSIEVQVSPNGNRQDVRLR
jgi:hypothetical protein